MSNTENLIINSHYHLTIKKRYLFDIKTMRDDYSKLLSASFYLGGPNIRCIEINYMSGFDFAKLSSIAFDKRCNILQNLLDGSGTHHMINTCFQFIKQQYGDKIKYLKLDDTSKKDCPDGNFIVLFSYSIAYYGKTWYEKHYNAYLFDEKKQDDYKKYLERLTSEEFKIKYQSEVLGLLPHDILRTLFISTSTFQDFFNQIKTIIQGHNNLCDFSADWLDTIIDYFIFDQTMSNYKIDWVIPLENIKTNDLTIETTLEHQYTIVKPDIKRNRQLYEDDLIRKTQNKNDYRCIRNYDFERLFFNNYFR